MDVDGSNVVTVADDPAGRSSTAPGRPTASGSSIATRRGASTRTTRSSSPGPTAPSGGTSPTTRRTTGARLVARRIDDRLQLGSRRRPAARLPRQPGRLEPSRARRRRVVRVPVVLAGRHADRVRGPRGVGDYDVFVADLATGAVTAADRQPGQRRLAGLVARRLDDRLHLGARRLRVRAAGPGVLARRRARRRASRHLADGRRRLRTSAGCHRRAASSSPGRPTAGTC